MRISDWSSDVCSSDLLAAVGIDRSNVGSGVLGASDGTVYLLAQRQLRWLAWTSAALAVAGVIGYAVAMGGLTGFAVLSGSVADVEPVRRDGMPLLALFWSGLKAGLLTFGGTRSEEHTSEIQSLMRISYSVF